MPDPNGSMFRKARWTWLDSISCIVVGAGRRASRRSSACFHSSDVPPPPLFWPSSLPPSLACLICSPSRLSPSFLVTLVVQRDQPLRHPHPFSRPLPTLSRRSSHPHPSQRSPFTSPLVKPCLLPTGSPLPKGQGPIPLLPTPQNPSRLASTISYRPLEQVALARSNVSLPALPRHLHCGIQLEAGRGTSPTRTLHARSARDGDSTQWHDKNIVDFEYN